MLNGEMAIPNNALYRRRSDKFTMKLDQAFIALFLGFPVLDRRQSHSPGVPWP
jgi:hypothetical protein